MSADLFCDHCGRKLAEAPFSKRTTSSHGFIIRLVFCSLHCHLAYRDHVARPAFEAR